MARLDNRGQASGGGRAAIRNVYPVLRIGVTGTADINRKLAMLSDSIRKRITRNALTAAARPMVAAAKTVAKSVAAQSKRHEGFGATARAMTVKVATSKKNPNLSYAIIGADRNYVELFHLQNPYQRSGVMLAQFQKRGKGGVMKAPKRLPVQKRFAGRLLGAAKRKVGGKLVATGGAVRRKPANYAHLIEYGTRRSAAYPIIARASQSRFASAAAFKTNFLAGVDREVTKLGASSSGRAAG